MIPFRRPAQGPGTPRVSTQQPAETLAIPAKTSTGLDDGTQGTALMAVIKSVPKHPAGRLGLSVIAAISGTVVTVVLNVPAQFRIGVTVVGAALPAFMTEPGPRQRQRILAAGLLTVAALAVTYGSATLFSRITGKQVYLPHRTVQPAPWTVIKNYFDDITAHDYQAAWQLKGSRLQTGSYAAFVAGLAGTGRQTVSKISMHGNQVNFTLQSDNPDGTVQTYLGTDTVTGGKIVAAQVVQTSGPPSA